MRRDQFDNRHLNLRISQAELERKWQLQLREQEEQQMYEALRIQAIAKGLGVGGRGNAEGTANSYMPEDYTDNDYVE
jgi:hypothetical protein